MKSFAALKALPPRRGDGGFTLLEIMVVLLIIGIMVTYASLSIGSRAVDDRLENEARRLEKLFQLASDEAQLQGLELGFRYSKDAYEFLGMSADSGWAHYADTGSLRPRPMDDPFYLELRVEGRPVAPVVFGDEQQRPKEKKEEEEKEEKDERDKDAKAIEPQLLLLSSGEMSPFELDIKARNYASFFRLQGDALGRLKLERFTPDQQGKR